MTRTQEDNRCWRFQCPECGMGDVELGTLAAAEEFYCEICLSEEHRTIYLRRWLVVEEAGQG